MEYSICYRIRFDFFGDRLRQLHYDFTFAVFSKFYPSKIIVRIFCFFWHFGFGVRRLSKSGGDKKAGR